LEAENREKLEAAMGIKDRQLSRLMALNARCELVCGSASWRDVVQVV